MFAKTIMLTLLAMLAVCKAVDISADVSHNVSSNANDGNDKEREKTEKQMKNIADGIDKANSALKKIKVLMTTTKSPNLKASISLMVEFYAFGALIFPQLKVFSSSLALLNGLIDGGGSGDNKVTKGIYMYFYES